MSADKRCETCAFVYPSIMCVNCGSEHRNYQSKEDVYMSKQKSCQTCEHREDQPETIDTPCLNCKGDFSEYEPRQEAKADASKLEIDLVPTQIIRDIAEVRMFGNKKYGDPNNWKQVELRRYINAMLRHTLAFIDDPYGVDPESGIPHYKHAECNWAFISEMMGGGQIGTN